MPDARRYLRNSTIPILFSCLFLMSCSSDDLAGFPQVGNWQEDKPSNLGNENSRWMDTQYDILKDEPLWNITLPASHDSAMYEVDCSVPSLFYGLVQAQSLDIGQQLEYGIRFFDLRFEHRDEGFFAYHGVCTGSMSLSMVLRDAVAYLQSVETAREFVILKFSHFKDMTTDLHEEFIEEVQGYLSGFLLSTADYGSLLQTRYGDLVSGGARVVVLYDDSGYTEQHALPSGFVTPGQFPVYDSYANTETLPFMENNQLVKLHEHAGSPQELFLLSWTLTPGFSKTDDHLVADMPCPGGPPPLWCRSLALRSVESLASTANPALGCFVKNYGLQYQMNFLYIDYVSDFSVDVTQIAMCLNEKKITGESECGLWQKDCPSFFPELAYDAFCHTPLGVALSEEAGYVVNDTNNLYGYLNQLWAGRVHNFADEPTGVAVSPDGSRIWVTTDGKELKSGDPSGSFNTLHSFEDDPAGVALGNGGTGYVITDDHELKQCQESSGDCSTIHSFEDNPTGVAVGPDGSRVWVVTDGNELKYGDSTGNFTGKYEFEDKPNGVALGPNGVGYVVTDGGEAKKCTEDTNTCDTIHSFEDEPIAVAVSPDGLQVWVLTNSTWGCGELKQIVKDGGVVDLP